MTEEQKREAARVLRVLRAAIRKAHYFEVYEGVRSRVEIDDAIAEFESGSIDAAIKALEAR